MHDNGGASDRAQGDGGWEYEFITTVPDEYACSICLKVLRDPKQIANCGHRFCAVCLSPILRKEAAVCPLDRHVIERERVFQDNACNRNILAFTVKCFNHRKACGWTGELRDAEEHRKTCPKEEVKCRNAHCRKNISREQIANHERSECEWRIVACEYCTMQHPLCSKTDHLQSCRRMPLECINKCERGLIAREEIDVHLSRECPKAMVKCEHADLGCTTLVLRENLAIHLEAQVRQHLDLACRKLATANLKVTELCKQLEPQDQRMQDIEGRLSQLERAPNKEDGKLLWKIDNYEERLLDCRNKKTPYIYSDPFFSGRYGYKLQASVTLNGDGDGEGTHMSIYIILMKGKYDALLPWPFRQKVTFYLLDQSEDYRARRDLKMEYQPDPSLEGYRQPQTERNAGVGIWRFAAHEKISEGARFLIDDTIFVKIEIEPFDLLGFVHAIKGLAS